MADRKATNKYYPPEYFDEYLEKGGKGGLNTFRGQHPLRERAKKLQDGILRIRFEMPFNVWCNGCGNHIGKGVRYNADKKKVGMYYSTPIYSFRMKCHLCDNYLEIRTDPQGRDYVVTEGGSRKVEEWSAADAETVDLSNVGTAEGMRGGVDPFSALEVEVVQIKEAEEGKKRLRALQGYRDGQFKDDYASSRLLRSKFRAEKKSLREGEVRDQELKDRLGVSIPLVAPDKSDADLAKAAMSTRLTRKDRRSRDRSRILPRAELSTSSLKSIAANAERKLRERGVDVRKLSKRPLPTDAGSGSLFKRQRTSTLSMSSKVGLQVTERGLRKDRDASSSSKV